MDGSAFKDRSLYLAGTSRKPQHIFVRSKNSARKSLMNVLIMQKFFALFYSL